ncbi:MAG: alpha/beta hydrolase [Nonlabens sp.]
MKTKKEKSSISKWLFRVWIAGGLFFMVWQWSAFEARGLPEGVLESDDEVTVTETDDYILFESLKKETNLEVIFLQGALTDPEAYAPLCRKIAESGFDTRLITTDFRLPIYFKDQILEIVKKSDKDLVIGGHSQGAKVAAELVYEHPTLFEALFLLGSSHPRDIDLSSLNIPVIKLYAEYDGLASVQEVKENLDKMPPHAITKLIECGNHSQFGYLGHLFMDDDATISLEEQQKITEKELIKFLNTIKKPLKTEN